MPLALSEHDYLVRRTVAEMERQNLTGIKAAHIEGYAQPEQIGNYIPDVIAFAQGKPCIAECESRDGLAQTHTAEQWRTFYRQAVYADGYFIAVVAKADEAEANALLQLITEAVQNAQVWTF